MAKRHKKVKLTKTEKLARDIARWEAKHNAAKDMLVRSTVELKVLYKKRQRARTTAPTVEPQQRTDEATPVELEGGLTASPPLDQGVRFGPDEAIKRPTDVRPPKRERKAKAMDDPNHPDLVAARALLGSVNAAARGIIESAPSPETREARMQAMGFRKLGRKR